MQYYHTLLLLFYGTNTIRAGSFATNQDAGLVKSKYCYSKSFESVSGKQYPTKGDINCNTDNIIYRLPKNYIGKTITPLIIRKPIHSFDIVHPSSERHSSSHAVHKHITNGIELRDIYHEECNPKGCMNLSRIRNVEIAAKQ